MSQVFKKHTRIDLVKVDLGVKTILVPVAHIDGQQPGPTLLITAGNDGDEYAGISAAYKLIEIFCSMSFRGTLIVIPIVNIPGFGMEISANPMDFLYPKHKYPGSPTGKPTDRLRYWLSTYVKQSQFWLDMHDGALTERLVPFLFACKTGVLEVDNRVESIIQSVHVKYAAYISHWASIKRLAQQGCGYIIAESAAFGHADEKTVHQHVDCARIVMSVMGMLPKVHTNYSKQVFRSVRDYVVRKKGIWMHTFPADNHVIKGKILGDVRSLDGNSIETIKAKESGILLWGKEGLRANVKDVVAGVGFNEI